MPELLTGRRESRPGLSRRLLTWFRKPALRRALVLVLLPLMVSGGIPATVLDAQEAPLAGRTVSAIEFKGLKMLAEETMLYYLGLQPGEPISEERLNRSIKDLWDRGYVDDIQVESVPEADGSVRLVITVVERPVLRSIDFEGVKRLSKTDILDKISTERIQVREGEPMSQGELYRVKALVEQLYAEKGYRFAQARFNVEDVGPNEKRVIFTVDEGDRVRIGDIQFEGNQVYNDMRLQWVMKNTKESGPVSRVLKKDIYDPAKLQEDLDKVRELYRAAGYKNVVIGDPQVEVRAMKPNAATEEQQKRRMFITLPIEEGERWKFGEVSIEGNTTYSDQALMRAFQQKPGSWLRSKVLDEAVKAVNDTYHNTGYIFAQVEPELIEREGQVADVVVHIQEGDQYRVGRIEFEGNERTMDKVLRREVRLFEGGVVNVGAIRNSVLKVNQLGYFKLNDEDPVQVDPDTEKKQVNVLFKGDEAERTELQFGGGWSELDGFFGQFAISTKNFLGRGEQVGLSFQSGRFRDFFDLSYYIPWFLDKPQSIGLRAFDQDLNFTGTSTTLGDQRFSRTSRGGSLTYGRNFRLFQSMSFSYNRAQYQDSIRFNPTTGTTPSVEVVDQVIDSSSLRPVYLFDSRDNPFEPTRGSRLSLSTEYAGGFLGGDNYFFRPEITYSLFKRLAEAPLTQIFAINVEGGLVSALDEGEYPLSPLELYYLGGEQSIRGHRYRSLSLRDDNGNPVIDRDRGYPLGGEQFLQINLEYHVLLGGPFRVLGFVDAGNVFGEGGQSFNLSNLRYTAGAELRVLIPAFGAPLRFIYAFNLDEQPGDRPEKFQFSIGTSF
jgi:outer membrane protein insertion porin family